MRGIGELLTGDVDYGASFMGIDIVGKKLRSSRLFFLLQIRSDPTPLLWAGLNSK
jgi:hypothetical protein